MKLFAVLLVTTFSFAQEQGSKIDSLKHIVRTSTNDSVIMLTYNALRRTTYYSDAETSKQYTKQYLKFATKLKDSHHIALGRFFLGNAEVLSGNYDTALSHYIISGNYYERKKDSSRLCSVLNSIGAVYEKTMNDSLSLHYYKRSLRISKSLSDKRRSGIASINIGNIYNDQGDFETSITFLEDGVSDLSINPKHKSFLILGELNLANAYGQNKDYKKAFDLYKNVLTKVDTTKDVYNYANVLRGISDVLVHQKEYKKSLPYAEKAYRILSENNFTDDSFQLIPELIEIHEVTGNYKKAVTLYSKYTKIKDSLFTETKDKNIAEAVQKYETEKKDAQLKLMQIENEKKEQEKRLSLALAIAGIFIALLLSYFVYRNKKQQLILSKQKAALEVAIDQKNILFREIHHRVKNSLQMVSSLLFLQGQNINDAEAKNAIRDAQNRVRSLSLIHQKLYNKKHLVGVETKAYISDLVQDIFNSHQLESQHLHYHLDIEDMVLNVDSLTPIGLIINELIVNVLKHAFEDTNSNNQLDIKFHKEDKALILNVKDNGFGFDETKVKKTSFGIKLIKSLALKLEGIFTIQSNHPKGTEAILVINDFEIINET